MSNTKLGRTVDPNSSASLAHGIYARFTANGVAPDGKAIRAAFIAELKGKDGVVGTLTEGTAQVYYHNCRKALGLTSTRPRSKVADAPAADTVATSDNASADTAASNDSTEASADVATESVASEQDVAQAA